MRLTKIHLQGFRNHQDSTLELGDASFVVLRGSNFSGKSSIGQAISMGLTPSTMGLDAQGRGFQSKIKRGESKAVITLTVQGKHTIEQTVTLNTNTSGRTSRATCLDDPDWHPSPFEKFLERYKDALTVALNTDSFLSLGEKEQKNLLAKLALPERYNFPEDKVLAVAKAIGANQIDFDQEPFAVIAAAYKKLYDERAVVNRQVKEFTIPDPLPTVPGVDSATLQSDLSLARGKRQTLSVERDNAVRKAGEVEIKRARLLGRIGTLDTDLKEQQNKLPNAEALLLPTAKLKELTKIAGQKEEYERLEKERTRIAGVIAAKKAEIARLNEVAEEGDTCPTCDQPIEAERLVKLGAKAVQERDAAQREDTEVLRLLQALGDVQGAMTSMLKHQAAQDAKKSLESAIAEKSKALNSVREELQAMGKTEDATLPFNQPLTAIDIQITRLEEQLRPVIAAENRKAEIERRTQEKQRLQAKAASLDSLVEYFGKDGIKARLLAEHIGGFTNRINEVLDFWGYKADLSIDPYQFEVTDTHGVTTPVRELSGSEQLMFSVALQCAVSRAAGIGLVVADRMDTFLPTQRQKANRCLYSMVDEQALEQVILIVSDENTEIPKLEGAAFFMVKDGTVERLK